MSKPYPSRRELRLQRERAERARLREAELQRWTDEVEQREQPPVERPEPVPASNQDGEAADSSSAQAEPTAAEPATEEATSAAEGAESPQPRRHRRAESPVTSTGMLPIISKPTEDTAQPKPRSRREARELEAQRAAQRRAEAARLQREQDAETETPKPRRRASAPQTTPPAAQVDTDTAAEPAKPFTELDEDVTDVEMTSTHELSATEITDMSGLDTIEIRRAELRAETERLTQEIIQLGESNPNVIDSKLLRRQKELAQKSQELQDLETAAIELVEADTDEVLAQADPADQDVVAEDTAEESVDTPSDDATPEASEPHATTPEARDGDAADDLPLRRSRRRTTQGPFVSGPFEISDDDDDQETASTDKEPSKKPPLAEFIHAPVKQEPPRDPREPLEASSAHGLDTLDARDVEAPDRRLWISAVAMFAIGLVALIIAIILLV